MVTGKGLLLIVKCCSFPQKRLHPLWLSGSLCLGMLSTVSTARAQIIPDETLPNPTRVTPNGNINLIEGGVQVGRNLFHSFQEFSVLTGHEANFKNSGDIQNILSRVTGGKISNIDGVIRSNGTANLFLINPHGIIFGTHAQLNIGGSFFGSTANSIKFSDGGEFSATNPQEPPLLTINVPIGLQFGSNPAPIINQSVAKSSLTATDRVGLETPGRTLALVGGDLLLDGGNLTSFQGQIELGSVTSGLVNLTPTATGFTLGYQGIQDFGTIKLAGGAAVNVSGSGSGTIRFRGGQITLTEGSKLLAETFGNRNGGGIDIQGNQFQLQEGSFVSTSTFGAGNGGSLRVRADAVELTGTTPLETDRQLLSGTFNPYNLSNGLFSLSVGSGAAGNLTIDTGRLIVQNGANLLTTTFANGIGGNLTLKVSELADLTNGSLLFTGTAGTGDAGHLAITAKQLRVIDGTALSTTPAGTSTGRGGNLSVTADAMEVRGTPAGAVVPGGLFTTTLGLGDAGDLNITTGQMLVADGAQISASSTGRGRGGNLTVTADSVDIKGKSADGRFLGGLYTSSSLLTLPGQQGTAPAGNLSITTRRLRVSNGAQISTATGSDGTAGNLRVNASESVEVIGSTSGVDPSVERVSFGSPGDDTVPSGIEANTRGAGRAGDLVIDTGQLTVREGAQIGVRATRSGAAGNLTVTADSILLEEQGLMNAVQVSGGAGNIELNARSVQLNNGIINASVLGDGYGGNITIRASDSVVVNGSGLDNLLNTIFFPALSGRISLADANQGIVTATVGEGSGGNITIETGRLSMEDGGLIATTTLGKGAAGNLRINASESVGVSSSFVSTSTLGSGHGGNIDINTRQLLVKDLGVLTASTLSSGKGGDLTLHASELVEVAGASPDGQISSNFNAGVPLPTTGTGGDISITTPKLIIRDRAGISVSSQGSGNAGNINANLGSFLLDGGAMTATSFLGKGGNINLQVGEDLVLRHQSQISTQAGTQDTGGGDGGNININTGVLAVLENSTINANAFKGSGGNIRISTRGIFVSPDSSITASSVLGVDGAVEINRLAVDPSQGLVQLPTELTAASQQISTGCPARRGNSFTITGRGGLPEDPTQTLRGSTVWQDWRLPSNSTAGVPSPPVGSDRDGTGGELPPNTLALTHPQSPIVEAQGWVINAQGEVELVAQVPHGEPQHPWYRPTSCTALR